jgi:hypothetical protein
VHAVGILLRRGRKCIMKNRRRAISWNGLDWNRGLLDGGKAGGWAGLLIIFPRNVHRDMDISKAIVSSKLRL